MVVTASAKASEAQASFAPSRAEIEIPAESGRVQGHHVAAFEGTFAPNARPTVQAGKHAPWYRNRGYYLCGWLDAAIWRAAVVEAVGTASLVIVSGQIGATLIGYGTKQVGAYIGISNIFLLSTFIYATAPASGGHLNPLITFATMLTGICSCPRAILYMCGQTLGAAVAGGVLTGIWGRERSIQIQGSGCFYDAAEVEPGQVFLNEVAGSFVLLFLAFGVGLDPRQAMLFGPRLGPLLVGVSLGLVSFASSGMISGYTGAQMNPSRCFAFGIARRNMSDQWIWWFGPAIASVLQAVMYNLIPPHHSADDSQPEEQVSRSSAGGTSPA